MWARYNTHVSSVIDARSLDHNEIALVLAFGGLLQATDNSLRHLDQTGLFGRVAVDLIRSTLALNAAFTEPLCAYLVAHVRLCEQADVRLGGVHTISRLEGVEACSVQDDIVALFAGIGKNVDVVGTGGAGGCIGDEESKATAKLEVYNTSDRGVSNELFSNGPLLITVIDVRRKGGGRRVLGSGQWGVTNKIWVSHGNTGGCNKSRLISSKMSSLENGATGIAIFVDSDPTIIGLDSVINEEHENKVFDHPL